MRSGADGVAVVSPESLSMWSVEQGPFKFGELAQMAADPIGDVRGTAAYRLHAVGVLARRTLKWAWDEYRGDDRAA